MSETAPQPAPPDPVPANPRALPPGFRPGWGRLALMAIGVALTYVLYSRFGTDSDSLHEGRSVIGWIVHQWRIPGGDFESMWIMPVVCLVSAWLSRRRLAEAEKLLKTTDLQIAEIASSCGFCSSAYFVERFRAAYGTTPRHWRLEHRA